METFEWNERILTVVSLILALLIIWRGQDRAALGMAIWALALLLGGNGLVPLDGLAGLALMLSENLCFLLARIGFFVMADAVANRGSPCPASAHGREGNAQAVAWDRSCRGSTDD